MRRLRALPAALTCAVLIGVLAAPAADAGQIVWVKAAAGGGAGELWAANDDGTYPHRLLAASAPAFTALFGPGSLSEPDLFQLAGTTVLFSAASSATAAPANPLACMLACSASFTLTAGVLARQSPLAAVSPGGLETQPRLAGATQMVDQYATSATPPAGATSPAGIYVRPLNLPAPGTTGTLWADTASESLPVAADPAPDPANPSLLAWVSSEDPSCTRFVFRGAPACQYEIHVGTASATTAPAVTIFDDETPGGAGPTSLSWSSDGKQLLVVDDSAPNNGIYRFPASTAIKPSAKQVTEVLAEPDGWTFGQARFAGNSIIFDARGNGRNTPRTSDIYSIPASCTFGACAFAQDARNLTASAGADNIDPAWTSAAAPLLALGVTAPSAGSPPPLDAARILARTVTASAGVHFEVTLGAAGSLVVTLSRSGHALPPTTLRLPAGASTFRVRPGGHALAAGRYQARLRVRGGAGTFATTFTVR